MRRHHGGQPLSGTPPVRPVPVARRRGRAEPPNSDSVNLRPAAARAAVHPILSARTGVSAMTYIATNTPRSAGQARLDDAHSGDILGAFGTIAVGETQTSSHWRRRLMTLFAILGPGLIVMVGDNDAGAFGTYAQAGQNYGTSLLWTLLLLVPVLFVNQEMVLRLGAVTGVGHARLIFERFGRFWGAFSVIDLFLLNALTIVTEFIGITLGLDYLGLPRLWGVIAAALVVIAAASTGSVRPFERV